MRETAGEPAESRHGGVTLLLYGVFACMAFLLNGLGAVLAPLQRELGVSRGDVAFYPSLFAVGLLVVGVGGGRLVGAVGRPWAVRLSILGMIGGGLLLAAPGRIVTLLGALLLGVGSALLIQMVPALLVALHPRTPTAVVGEANGLASTASVLAPLAVGGALAAGLGWRAGYLAAPLLIMAAVLVPAWRASLPSSPTAAAAGSGPAAPMWGRWLDVLLSVSVEFCIVFWAASAIAAWHGTSAGLAPAVASLFLVGMATVRLAARPVTARVPGHRTLIVLSVVVAAAGFAVFWAAPPLPLAAAGLLVTGMGVGLLYPTTVSRVVAAWPQAPDRAAARGALASGLAIGGAPFVLARLSDAAGLHAAYLIVPALLAALAARTWLSASPRV